MHKIPKDLTPHWPIVARYGQCTNQRRMNMILREGPVLLFFFARPLTSCCPSTCLENPEWWIPLSSWRVQSLFCHWIRLLQLKDNFHTKQIKSAYIPGLPCCAPSKAKLKAARFQVTEGLVKVQASKNTWYRSHNRFLICSRITSGTFLRTDPKMHHLQLSSSGCCQMPRQPPKVAIRPERPAESQAATSFFLQFSCLALEFGRFSLGCAAGDAFMLGCKCFTIVFLYIHGTYWTFRLWCAQPLGCTRHATRGLKVTMLSGQIKALI